MDKLQYKKILEMRQNQELMFFQLIGYLGKNNFSVRDIINITHIPKKRACYILQKWVDKGWYDYGVSLDLGWLRINQMPLYISW